MTGSVAVARIVAVARSAPLVAATEARAIASAFLAARRSPDRELPMFLNSVALILAKVCSLGLGFLSWIVAARLFDAAEVGIAAAVVAAMMLCVQVALVGVGSSIINLYPAERDAPRPLLDTAFSIVGLASLAAAAGFVVLAAVALDALRVVAADPRFMVAFVALVLLGALGVLLDQVSTVMRRGDEAFVRNLVTGVVTLAGLAVVAAVATREVALGVVVAWVAGSLGAVVVGWWQLRRASIRYRYGGRVEPGRARRLVGLGIPNWLLTLFERAPNSLLPLVVTQVLSPAANARWYAVWMLAWVVFIVPIQVGLSAFAEASHHPDRLESIVRRALRSSLGIGVAGALGLTLLAEPVLALLGPGYAAAGATPLRILVWTVVPMAAIQAYFSICRATRRLAEATWTAAAATIGGVALAALGASIGGLALMSATWLAGQTVVAAWSLLRVRALVRSAAVPQPGVIAVASPAVPPREPSQAGLGSAPEG